MPKLTSFSDIIILSLCTHTQSTAQVLSRQMWTNSGHLERMFLFNLAKFSQLGTLSWKEDMTGNVEESGCDLLTLLPKHCLVGLKKATKILRNDSWLRTEKCSGSIGGSRSEILVRHLPDTTQECWPPVTEWGDVCVMKHSWSVFSNVADIWCGELRKQWISFSQVSRV